MSVNIVGEDKNLIQVAGNVPTDKVALITQLATQAEGHAKQAQELARQAQELAGSAEAIASNALPRYRTQGNLQSTGWYRAFKIESLFNANMIVNITRKGSGDSSEVHQISVVINWNGDKKNVSFAAVNEFGEQYLGNVRVVEDDGCYFDFYYNFLENSDDIIVEVFGFTSEGGVLIMNNPMYRVTTEPKKSYSFRLSNVGAVADRAFSDSDGNNLADAVQKANNALPKLRIIKDLSEAGWYRVFKFRREGALSFVVTVVKQWTYNMPNLLKFLVTINESSANPIEYNVVFQQDAYFGAGSFLPSARIVRENDVFYLEIYYKATVVNTVTTEISSYATCSLRGYNEIEMVEYEKIEIDPVQYWSKDFVASTGRYASRAEKDTVGRSLDNLQPIYRGQQLTPVLCNNKGDAYLFNCGYTDIYREDQLDTSLGFTYLNSDLLREEGFERNVFMYVSAGNLEVKNIFIPILEVEAGRQVTLSGCNVGDVFNSWGNAIIIGGTIHGSVVRGANRFGGTGGIVYLRQCNLVGAFLKGDNITLENCTGYYFDKQGVYHEIAATASLDDDGGTGVIYIGEQEEFVPDETHQFMLDREYEAMHSPEIYDTEDVDSEDEEYFEKVSTINK